MRTFKEYFEENKAVESLKGWEHDDARDYAIKLIEQFGEPDEVTENMLLWNNIEPPFESVYIKDESIPHEFPASHRDYVYSTMNIDVPADMLDTLGHVTGSIIYDGLKKEVTARCGDLYANAATLGFVKDMVDGKVPTDFEEAKKEYANRIQKAPLPDWYPDSMEEDK